MVTPLDIEKMVKGTAAGKNCQELPLHLTESFMDCGSPRSPGRAAPTRRSGVTQNGISHAQDNHDAALLGASWRCSDGVRKSVVQGLAGNVHHSVTSEEMIVMSFADKLDAGAKACLTGASATKSPSCAVATR